VIANNKDWDNQNKEEEKSGVQDNFPVHRFFLYNRVKES
jgi:hypothetical protein